MKKEGVRSMKKVLLLVLLIALVLFVASCDRKETHTLTLYNNGGEPGVVKIKFESMQQLPHLKSLPTKVGYEFGGYFTVNKCPIDFDEWFNTYIYDYRGASVPQVVFNHDTSGYACWLRD